MPKKNDAWKKLIEENSSNPVLYYFSQDNCPFCVRAKPYIDVLAEKYKKFDLKVITVDIDSQQDVANAANVEQYPAYILVEDGEVKARDIGWEEGQRVWLEERLGIDKQFGLLAGLALSQEEMDAIKEDPNAQVGGVTTDEYANPSSNKNGCGDSTQQVAEIAAGMDEALTRIDNKLRSILARLDAIESRFVPLSDDIIAAIGSKPESGKKCKCGKHKED
jgi:thiol-disulfide isomerase/thioredoxin